MDPAAMKLVKLVGHARPERIGDGLTEYVLGGAGNRAVIWRAEIPSSSVASGELKFPTAVHSVKHPSRNFPLRNSLAT